MLRDSGPAVAVAATLAAAREHDALVLVLAADHAIAKPEAFREACRGAATCFSIQSNFSSLFSSDSGPILFAWSHFTNLGDAVA
jgi:mannose-1-phosphate guanylyltransferase